MLEGIWWSWMPTHGPFCLAIFYWTSWSGRACQLLLGRGNDAEWFEGHPLVKSKICWLCLALPKSLWLQGRRRKVLTELVCWDDHWVDYCLVWWGDKASSCWHERLRFRAHERIVFSASGHFWHANSTLKICQIKLISCVLALIFFVHGCFLIILFNIWRFLIYFGTDMIDRRR